MAETRKLPNVLVYFIDELRADVLGCYGHPFVETPAIDRIAAEGMQFDWAITNCPLCMPARNSFFTGLYPSEHGILCNSRPEDLVARYAESPPRYAFGQLLREAGYDRIINIGKHHTGFDPAISGFTEDHATPDRRGANPGRPPEGIDRGEAHIVKIPGHAPNTIIAGTYPGDGRDTHAHVTVDQALALLAEMGESPWVLRISIDSPHTPVMPPEPYASIYVDAVEGWSWDPEELDMRTGLLRRWHVLRGFGDISLEDQRWARACYFGLTSYLDAQIDRLESELARRGLNENLITIFIADHGASIGDHGLQVKGPFDTDDIAHVPLLIRYPGHVPAGHYAGLVQTIDVVPTLVELLGVAPVGVPVSGSSLAPVLAGTAASLHDAVISVGTFPHSDILEGVRESVRTPAYLYTRYPAIEEYELFDLEEDPGETRNIHAQQPTVAAHLDEVLDTWRAVHGGKVDLT